MKDLLLRQVPLLASLPPAELDRLTAPSALRKLAPGSILVKEGERGDDFLIILSGQAQVVKALGTDDERTIATLGPGEFIGEMSLLNPNHLRTASVRSATDLELLAIPLTEFDALLKRYPSAGYELAHVLGQRLDATNNATIRDLHEKNSQLSGLNRKLADSYQRLRRTRHFAIALLVVFLLIVSSVAGLLAYYWLSARTALDKPTDLVLTMFELGRTIVVPADAAARPNPQARSLTPDTLVNVRRLYTGRCSTCHGPDGKGDTSIGSHIYPRAADLTSDVTQGRTDGAIFWIVANGSPHTGMPGWTGTLSDDEMWQVVSYMRLLPKGLDVIANMVPTPLPTPTASPTATPAPTPTTASTAAAAARPVSSPTTAPIAATTAVTVTISDYTFVPSQAVVQAGARLVWFNTDDDEHNMFSDSKPPVFQSSVIALKQSFDFIFDKPGTYAYSCTLHDFMHATVVVQ
jgi:CRP-like cAMP-binding protein/plastocyanin/mono/diheme cytochrome c family protein